MGHNSWKKVIKPIYKIICNLDLWLRKRIFQYNQMIWFKSNWCKSPLPLSWKVSMPSILWSFLGGLRWMLCLTQRYRSFSTVISECWKARQLTLSCQSNRRTILSASSFSSSSPFLIFSVYALSNPTITYRDSPSSTHVMSFCFNPRM